MLSDPQVWSGAITGLLIALGVYLTRFQDGNRKRMKTLKRNTKKLYEMHEQFYSVRTAIIRHNSDCHSDGVNALTIPIIPDPDTDEED